MKISTMAEGAIIIREFTVIPVQKLGRIFQAAKNVLSVKHRVHEILVVGYI